MMKRVFIPALSVFVVMSVSYARYFGSRHLAGGLVQQWMACFFGITYFISIAFGTLYVFTSASGPINTNILNLRGGAVPGCLTCKTIPPKCAT